jgi:glycosyltransferase involved in cell wall biosynthesis
MPATPAAAGQPGCRLAILSSSLGKRSETFIHRHMLDLAPGETVVVAGRREPGLAPELEAIPHLELGEARRDLRWLWQSGLYLLRATRETPTQRRARAFLEMHRPGVLLGEYMNQSLRWLPLAERMRLPFFVHAHGYDVSASLRDPATCRRYLQYERARGIIVFADVCRRRLVGLGLSGANIHVIPYGVDVPGAPPGHAARETVRCLAVGRMTAKKAPLLTLEAFARALAAYPHMRLDFVGTGELFEEARSFVARRGLETRVTLHGGQPHAVVLGLMRECDIFLQHSRTDPVTGDEEGLPVAILEAMAHALPVVSTRHAGIPEAVIEGVNGLLVDEGDVDGMAQGLSTLARDAELRRRFGHAGWERARQQFTWELERTRLRSVLGLDAAGHTA